MPSRARRQVREYVASRVVTALQGMQQAIMETPVYTGRTIVNYNWSIGSPVTSTRAPVKSPALPGKTSDMSIGEEPRRKANAALVQAELSVVIGQIKRNPYQRVYLTNNVPHFDLVEYGTYDVGKNNRSRTPPGGMVRRGETTVRYALGGLINVT